jgi:hypothetical protein
MRSGYRRLDEVFTNTTLRFLVTALYYLVQTLQQVCVNTMRELLATVGMAVGRLYRAKHLLNSDQKVVVVVFSDFGAFTLPSLVRLFNCVTSVLVFYLPSLFDGEGIGG